MNDGGLKVFFGQQFHSSLYAEKADFGHERGRGRAREEFMNNGVDGGASPWGGSVVPVGTSKYLNSQDY